MQSRPHSLDDIVEQDEIVRALRSTLSSANLPHLLFYGSPGTGKTSTILAIARELYGPELLKSRVLELNASDERGINVVRTKIKTFAQQTVGTKQIPGFPCPPYKIVILDEADSMTKDAQSALRRTMELHSNVTRFCLICNYVSKIIDPIASRCAKFRFKPLEAKAVTTRLERICLLEGLEVSPEGLDAVVKVSKGDLRNAITLVQSARLFQKGEGVISVDTITLSAGIVPLQLIEESVEVFLSNTKFGTVREQVKKVIDLGYAVDQVLDMILEVIVTSSVLNSVQKSQIALAIASADKCLSQGSDEYIQLLSVASRMFQIARC